MNHDLWIMGLFVVLFALSLLQDKDDGYDGECGDLS
jgi:hypothetical protein